MIWGVFLWNLWICWLCRLFLVWLKFMNIKYVSQKRQYKWLGLFMGDPPSQLYLTHTNDSINGWGCLWETPFSTISYTHIPIFIHDDCQLNRLNVSCYLISSSRRYVLGTHAPNFQKCGRQNYVFAPLPLFWQKFRKSCIFSMETKMWSLRRVIRLCFKCNFVCLSVL